MRVLIANDWGPETGGVETYLTWLRAGLTEAGNDVRLLTSSAGSAAGGSADDVAFAPTGAPGRALLQLANPAALLAVRRAVREFRPDVVHVTMFELFLSPAVFAALDVVPTVLSISYYKPICPTGIKVLPTGARCESRAGLVCLRSGCVGLPHWLRDRPRYALIRRAVERADKIVTCSRWMAGELGRHGIVAEPLVWPVPAPSPSFRRSRAADPLFVYAGRLNVAKGVDVLLRAFAQVVAARPAARLAIVGDGPVRAELEALSRELRIAASVEFRGAVAPSEVERAFADAWALVAPSRWAEPFGSVAAEAVVRGVPVVATGGGGFAETVDLGVTGLLVPPGDASALAAALGRIADGALRELPLDAVARARTKHDAGRHLEAVERAFSEARFARFGTSLTPPAARRLNPS